MAVIGQICREMADDGATGLAGRPAIPHVHCAQRSVVWHGRSTPTTVLSDHPALTQLHFPLEVATGGTTTVVGVSMTSRHISRDHELGSVTMPAVLEAFSAWSDEPQSAEQEAAEVATQDAATAAVYAEEATYAVCAAVAAPHTRAYEGQRTAHSAPRLALRT